MGIQDRDYYQEWKSGRSSTPSGRFSEPAQSEQPRRFRVIDKVRVRPSQQEPERVFVQRESDYTVAFVLVFLVIAALGWLAYLVFGILR